MHSIVFDGVFGGIAGAWTGFKKSKVNNPSANKIIENENGRFLTDDNGNIYSYYDKEAKNWKLYPDMEYKSNGYTYTTDSEGRIATASGKLRLSDSERQSLNAKVDGMLDSDDRGHIIADRFDGSNRNDNLIAQNRSLNRGDYKKLENTFADVLKDGGTVEADYFIQYKAGDARPIGIEVDYKLTYSDGTVVTGNKNFINKGE